MANTFFYDGQIRRFLYQFIKIMSHFTVEFGADRAGNQTLQTVPVVYGDPSRMAAQILQGNTENAMPSVPCIACYIGALDYDRNRVQEPYHISKVQIRERRYDSATDTFGHERGDSFTVERAMPVPYKLTMKVDIWTSNTEQKLQLIEQMLPLFNPALEIQSTDNYLDWTSLSAIYLMSTSWDSRTVPAGAGGQISISNLTFELPIWISLPVKVKKMGVIQKIINSMYDVNGDLIGDITDLANVDQLARQVLTPMNYGLVYLGNALQLVATSSQVNNPPADPASVNGVEHPWQNLLDTYGGTIQNGITTVRLDQPNGQTVVGTVSMHPTDPTLLLFSPFGDTIPSNTLLPITAIIDPFNMPVDSSYINAPIGTRYLILHDIGSPDNISPAIAWHGTDGTDLIAETHDIIELVANSLGKTRWVVAFNASGQADVKYVTNLKSGLQFKWDPTIQEWTKSIEGAYQPGNWTIVLTM
jgi:hypothetical protein